MPQTRRCRGIRPVGYVWIITIASKINRDLWIRCEYLVPRLCHIEKICNEEHRVDSALETAKILLAPLGQIPAEACTRRRSRENVHPVRTIVELDLTEAILSNGRIEVSPCLLEVDRQTPAPADSILPQVTSVALFRSLERTS